MPTAVESQFYLNLHLNSRVTVDTYNAHCLVN